MKWMKFEPVNAGKFGNGKLGVATIALVMILP